MSTIDELVREKKKRSIPDIHCGIARIPAEVALEGLAFDSEKMLEVLDHAYPSSQKMAETAMETLSFDSKKAAPETLSPNLEKMTEKLCNDKYSVPCPHLRAAIIQL